MPISWTEHACLSQPGKDGGFREIVAEGSFAEVAKVLARYRTDAWSDLCIAFPERKIPPLYFHEPDFGPQILGRLFELEIRSH